MRTVTIQDIAREAGVGKSTVSRVINGTGYVHMDTVEKVKTVMDKYNYQPSAAARSLSRQESDTIGLILPEVNNPFFADILKGVSQMVDKCGYTLILCGSDNEAAKEARALEAMRRQRVKGLIIVPANDYSNEAAHAHMEKALHQLGCPLVVLDRPILRMDFDSVTTDNFSGAYSATEALIRAGHRRIGIIAGDLNLFIGRERYEGYCKAMEQNGLTVDPAYVIHGKFDRQITYEKMRQAIKANQLPTAYFVSNNLSEMGFLTAVNEARLSIPEDIAFIGFDKLQGQEVFNIPYSHLEREVLVLGLKAAQLLFRRFDNPERPVEKIVIVPRVKLLGSERLVDRAEIPPQGQRTPEQAEHASQPAARRPTRRPRKTADPA
jgi:LacI family transcriptional regulator